MNSEQRFAELESRLAFQEAAIDDMSRALARQAGEIDALQRALKILHERLQQLAPPEAGDAADEPPPPHY